jgi:predicted DNA-binding transcriptional regulator AlpA
MAAVINPVNEAESVEVARAARLLDVSRITFWRLVHNPDLGFPRPYRIDPSNPRSRLRVRLGELVRWIERQQQLTSEAARVGIHANKTASRGGATE